jgi:hypothetical protein
MTIIKHADYDLSNYRLRLDITRPSGDPPFALPPLIIPGATEDVDKDPSANQWMRLRRATSPAMMARSLTSVSHVA